MEVETVLVPVDGSDEASDAGDEMVVSRAAIPIHHAGTVYGVLVVYSERSRAFEDDERDLFDRLGAVIGHAITANERKQALMNESVTQLEFLVEDAFDSLGVAAEMEGRIVFEQVVQIGEGEYIEYGTVTAAAMDALDQFVAGIPYLEEVSVADRTADESRFEVTATEPPAISIVAENGGLFRELTIEDDELRMVVDVPTGTDIQAFVDTVEAAYPDTDIVSKRQQAGVDRSVDAMGDVASDQLTEKQRSALEAAYYGGFFEWPRESSGEEVAESMGVSAPTFHQHLRAAEQKLLDTVFEE
jgi:predicted DNA binding protein